MAGDIDVRDDSAFGHANSQMGTIVGQFQFDKGETAKSSASPAAAGAMPEGVAFMQQERQGRELLVQYMTKTSDGLIGYQAAIGQLDREHQGLVTLNNARLSTLMQPSEGAIPNDPAFNWEPIVANQAAQQNGGI